MSDSDAEFEKFLQESLSSSAASYFSQLSRSKGSASGGGWWQGNEEAPSDQELEATAQSWLKSTGLQSGPLKRSTGGASLQVTLPSAAESKVDDYSKDSLEDSGQRKSERASKSEDDDFQDTFSLSGSGRSSILSGSLTNYTSTHPGLDTLEENADKLNFFATLEQGRDTPLDYHKLNQQLDNTGRSSAVNQESGVDDTQNYDYQDDFHSSTTLTKDTHSQSSTSTTSVTPTNSYTNIEQDRKQETPPTDEDHGHILSPLQSTSLVSNQSDNDLRLNTSMKSSHVRDKHQQYSLLDSHKTHIRVGQRALARLPPAPDVDEEPKGFSLSPIHSQVLTKASADLSTSGHSFASSSSELEGKGQSVSLTPIHSTSTTNFKDTHQLKGDDKRFVLHQSPKHVVLSPLHQRDNAVTTSGQVNIGTSRDHSTHGTQLSSVRNKSGIQDETDQRQRSPTHSNKHVRVPSTVRALQQSAPFTVTHQLDNKSIAATHHPGNSPALSAAIQQPNISTPLEATLLAKTNIDSDSAMMKNDNADVNGDDTLTAHKLVTHYQSGLGGDLAELQSALQAAGLPGIEANPTLDENTVNKQHTLETALTMVQATPDSHQLSTRIHDTQQTLKSEANSQKVSEHQPSSVSNVHLKEAIRAIASEEITLISKELLERKRTSEDHHLVTDADQPTRENASERNHMHGDKDSQLHRLEDFDQLMKDISYVETQSSDKPRVSLKRPDGVQNVKRKATPNMTKKTSAPSSRLVAKQPSKVNSRSATAGKKQTAALSRPVSSSSHSQKRQPLKNQTKENRNPSTQKTKSQIPKFSTSLRPSQSDQSLTGNDRKKKKQPCLSMKKNEDNRSLQLRVTLPSSQIPPTEDSPSSSDTESQVEHRQVNDTQLKTLHNDKLLELERLNHQVETLTAQLTEMERRSKEKEELLRAEHNKEQTQLKQELFEMTVKVKDFETSQDPRKLLASGRGSTALITKEEKSALQQDIKEQEMLLQGYQKENERLYNQLTQFQKEAKATQSRLFEENQRFAAELLNTRSQLERQSHQLQAALSHSPTVTSASDNLDQLRITQLEEKLDDGEAKRKQLQNQVKQLTHTTHCLNQEIHLLKQERVQLESKMRSMVEWERLEELQTKHKSEVEALNKKIEWFSENQKLLDHDCELLKSRESEITLLKEKIMSLQRESQTRQREAGRTCGTDAKKIQQLEKHVKELETIIQKRYPNSLSALILTSNTPTTSSGQVESKQGSTKKQAPPTRAYLEHRVQQLEESLEARDKECSKKLRAMQQKCTTIELAYEKQIALLKQHQTKECLSESAPSSVTKLNEHSSESINHEMREPSEVGGAGIKLSLELKSMKQENIQLKEKLSELSFELAHQRVQLQGKLAEAESKATLLREELEDKLKQSEDDHKTHLDTLIAKFAREHSQSEITRLHSQLTSQEATIIHLKEKIECMKFETDQLAALKSREETLNKQLKVVSEQLLEAKRHLSPEMHHFMALQAKITALEERCANYERKISELQFHSINPTPSEQQIKEIEQKWRLQVHAKNAEIEHFREELDSLLSALQILQKGTSLSSTET